MLLCRHTMPRRFGALSALVKGTCALGEVLCGVNLLERMYDAALTGQIRPINNNELRIPVPA